MTFAAQSLSSPTPAHSRQVLAGSALTGGFDLGTIRIDHGLDLLRALTHCWRSDQQPASTHTRTRQCGLSVLAEGAATGWAGAGFEPTTFRSVAP